MTFEKSTKRSERRSNSHKDYRRRNAKRADGYQSRRNRIESLMVMDEIRQYA